MPQNITIQPIPNQTFAFNSANNSFQITLKATSGCMSMSLDINGADVIDNARCVAWRVIIPSIYEENGNFMFLTQQLQLPWYTKFGITQSLIYMSPTELAAIRANNLLFSPFGALPLRFQPSGYIEA